MKYDPEVIVERAEDLRRQAIEVQIVGTILYLLVGLAIGLVASLLISMLPPTSFWRNLLPHRLLPAAAGLVFAIVGLLRGIEEARDLRFRAHLALLHVEIERHLSKIARQPALR